MCERTKNVSFSPSSPVKRGVFSARSSAMTVTSLNLWGFYSLVLFILPFLLRIPLALRRILCNRRFIKSWRFSIRQKIAGRERILMWFGYARSQSPFEPLIYANNKNCIPSGKLDGICSGRRRLGSCVTWRYVRRDELLPPASVLINSRFKSYIFHTSPLYE